MTLFSISGLFVILEAQFIAAMQVLVYAGAIMVLFVFVIMLLNLGRERRTDRLGWIGSAVMFSVGALIVLELWVVRGSGPSPELVLPAGTLARMAEQQGAVGMISGPLFRDYLVPFEITSVLLLAAVIGAVVLAKRRL